MHEKNQNPACYVVFCENNQDTKQHLYITLIFLKQNQITFLNEFLHSSYQRQHKVFSKGKFMI